MALPSSSFRERPTTIPAAAATNPPATTPSPIEVAASSSNVVAKPTWAIGSMEQIVPGADARVVRGIKELRGGSVSRGAQGSHERQFWHALWRVPPIDAVEEHGIEARHYAPVRAFAYRHEPLLSMFNVVLGADLPGAISEGHLGDALSWTESMGLDVRIPLRGGSQKVGEAAEAADYLRTHGYRRTGMSATFARQAGSPGFEPPRVSRNSEQVE